MTYYAGIGGAVGVTLELRVHYPATATAPDSPVSTAHPTWPVVLMLHGQGYIASTLDGLATHLASHGHIVMKTSPLLVRSAPAD
jgi:predicted dienelactone hydrolase